MDKNKIIDQIELIAEYKHTEFSDLIVNDVCNRLAAVPEDLVMAAVAYCIHDGDFFTFSKLYNRITELVKQNPNHNPAQQWALVRKQLLGDDFCSLKVVFDNIRTNLAIEAMGGQAYLFDTYTEDREPFLRKEFIENFDKAVITQGLNWRDLNICFDPDRYTSFRKGTVYMIGYSIDREIPEQEADRLFVNAVNTRQELLTGQNVLAIAQGA